MNVPALVESNPALKHLVSNKGEKAGEAIQTIQQVFSYLTKYLDTTTSEQKNFLQDFTIDFSNGIQVVGSTIEITGFMKNGGYKDTPISFSYDMDSRDFAINTLLEHNTNADLFKINPSHPNKTLFQLPQNLDTTQGNAPLIFSKDTKDNMELNIEKNRTISTVLNLFYLNKQPPEYGKNDKGIYHMFQLLENSLTTLADCTEFRLNMQQLFTLIGGEIQEVSPTETPDPLKEEERKLLNRQKDEKLAESSSLLSSLFNSQKREKDRDRSTKEAQEGSANGLYRFLKRATPEIDEKDLDSTGHNEHQKIDNKEISLYLSFVANHKEKEYKGFITRGLNQ